jgi:hypothetical protein
MTHAAATKPAGIAGFSAESRARPVGWMILGTWLRRCAAEPFLHFTLLGALLFAGDALLSQAVEAPVIEVPAAKQREFAKLFEQRQGRAPTHAEQKQLVERYVEDEALFREGLRLSLVNTDPMLRAQMIARMRRMLQTEAEQKTALASTLDNEELKERTARAFQAEVARLASQWRVRLEAAP